MTSFFGDSAFLTLFILITVIFLIREWVTFTDRLPAKYILTPLITALNIGFVILSITIHGMDMYRLLILSALIASLIADVMLMLVVEQMTIYGILYFLGAHIIYSIAFAIGYNFQIWHLPIAALLVSAIIIFDRKVGRGNKNVRLLILAYAIALCLAGFFAFSGVTAAISLSSISKATGAFLFIVSDIFFGINNFKSPIKHSSVITWATYAPAQFLFALSCF